ncbi:MAG TPA: pantoate--beta-alanine ligase [Mariprofundaceae bacterium]|nr:pantoate--beta-alanine ligase [Mariprofundaceae bacterium]
MRIIESPASLRQELAPLRGKDRIALVPTMGCLHEGHLNLIRKARHLGDTVVVSIYVNPLQFGPNEDFASYPRTFDADADLCKAEEVDLIFHPQNLYPKGSPKVSLQIEDLADMMCGAGRPGHFEGVATVVNILFNVVQPDIAVFGEKDWQQLAIIRRMVNDLQMPVEVIGAETAREENGLAMSSRNRYLNSDERRQATALFSALEAMREAASAGATTGASQADQLIEAGLAILNEHAINPEYLEIRDEKTLVPLAALDTGTPRAFVAAKVGPARLIDNMQLT